MVHCISCEKYPTDERVIPYGSTFPIDTVKVKLISKTKPSTLPADGDDVENLADGTKFAVGSMLYIITGDNDVSETYIYVDGNFEP